MKHAPAVARIMAGVPDHNASLFRRIGAPLGDPTAWIELDSKRIALVRDLEMDRVQRIGHADEVTCPSEHSPPAGLSPDRETATAEAAAQLLRSAKVERIYADRIASLHLRLAFGTSRNRSCYTTMNWESWIADPKRTKKSTRSPRHSEQPKK